MRSWVKGLALTLLCWGQMAVAGTSNVLVVGDSISAAFGMDTSQGWVHMLQQRLDEQALDYQVVNASVSGETTTGGVARIDRLLEQHQPVIVILELGGNDGLRGQPPAQMQHNLAVMIDRAHAVGAKVLLLGMRLPPNLGRRYTEEFAQAFDDLVEKKDVAYVPFFLEGVGGVEGMMQQDGIHPAAVAQSRLLENAWESLESLL
ncbi:arylesterase [Stutzerimonas tarimensis]|uniref:Arylesterase n=1 Tax=Stutzerimonas tarimensis TaxID=1507735 RepID=A0ABV7T2U1_9GAMM